MPPTLYSDTNFSLSFLIEDIQKGNIALPDIQRPFVWSASKVRDLFDSMYRGYPIGTLMFWETGAEVGTKQIGGGENDKVARRLVVDGQQRLTALYAVLTGNEVLTKTFVQKHIRIAFRPRDETFEVTDAAIERDPEFIPDINVFWNNGYKSVVRAFNTRLGESRGERLGHDEQDFLEARMDRVRDLRDFRFQVIELSSSADEEQVAEIFVRINSEGVQLNQADFILTLMSVHWDAGRRQLETFARNAVDPAVKGPSPKNPFIDPSPDQMLRASIGLAFGRGRLQHVYSILRGKDLKTGEVTEQNRIEQFDRLHKAQDAALNLTNWFEFLKCLTNAGFRRRRMISSDNAIIYTYILWLKGKVEFGLDPKELRPVISRWFFMAQTTGRYSSSPESQLESDLRRLEDLPTGDGSAFCEELDRLVRSNFTGDYWDITLPNRLDVSSARSPALYAYWAALTLLDAELLFSEMKVRDLLDPGSGAPRSIERHHLFPKKFLADQGITARPRVNAIGNMAFLDWPENAAISADDPLDYWSVMIEGMDKGRLSRQVYWHALPVGWEQLEYSEFLEKRRSLMAKVIKEGFESLWDVKPAASTATSELADLLAVGESQTVEYKSTARWNVYAEKQDKKMEHVILKTVCGFLNAEGGSLLIGVDDESVVLGLDADMATFGSKGNRDGYELWLRQYLDNNLSVPTAAVVKIRFEDHPDGDVCVVSVASSAKATFAKPIDGNTAPSDFWVRIGNKTEQMHGDTMVSYQTDHWG